MKVGLISYFFMHLPRSHFTVRLAAAAAFLFVFFLAFLSFADLMSRPAEVSAPWEAPAAGIATPMRELCAIHHSGLRLP